jgi:hypothetical protein
VELKIVTIGAEGASLTFGFGVWEYHSPILTEATRRASEDMHILFGGQIETTQRPLFLMNTAHADDPPLLLEQPMGNEEFLPHMELL